MLPSESRMRLLVTQAGQRLNTVVPLVTMLLDSPRLCGYLCRPPRTRALRDGTQTLHTTHYGYGQ